MRLGLTVRRAMQRLCGGAYFDTLDSPHFCQKDAWDFLSSFEWQPWALAYHRNGLCRYLATTERLAALGSHCQRVLEIGAMPYGLSLLMRRHLFSDITVTSFAEVHPGLPVRGGISTDPHTLGQILEIGQPGGADSCRFGYGAFNVETDTWPYADGAFDLVVACEILEHLALDAMHMISEANRVLRPGGRLFVSCPNGMGMSKILRFLAGRQPSQAAYYRPRSVYYRHNREPTPYDVRALLTAGGFEVDTLETVNFDRPGLEGRPISTFVVRQLVGSGALCREYIFAVGRKSGPVRTRYPLECGLYSPVDAGCDT